MKQPQDSKESSVNKKSQESFDFGTVDIETQKALEEFFNLEKQESIKKNDSPPKIGKIYLISVDDEE